MNISIIEQRLYVHDEINIPNFGPGKIVAFLKPESYDHPVVIIENQEGERLAQTVDVLTNIEVVSIKSHAQVLFPGELITDAFYGVGIVKNVAAMDNDVVITVLYKKHFCVYRNEINMQNIIECKKIIPRYE